jgi:hypothetical protein
MFRKDNQAGQQIFKDANSEHELPIYEVNISNWRAFIFLKGTAYLFEALRAEICENVDI